MFRTGLWTIGRWRGVPIRLHWSIPIGALVFGRFRFVPGFWVGFVALILFHELGHAALARWRRLRIHEVQVHGLGGVCVHERGTPYDDALVAWGGVLAQAVFLVPALLVPRFVGVSSAFGWQLVSVFTDTNLFLIGLNLIPLEPFDGTKAWQLPRLWWRRRQRRGRRSPERSKTDPVDAAEAVERARRLAQEALDEARRRGG